MNWYLLAAGVLATLALVGHLTAAFKTVIRPILAAEQLDLLVRKSALAMAHLFPIVTFAVAAGFLLVAGAQIPPVSLHPRVIAAVCAALFGGYGVAYLAVALSFKGGLGKLFQWVLFFAICALCVIGGPLFPFGPTSCSTRPCVGSAYRPPDRAGSAPRAAPTARCCRAPG